MKQFGLIQIYTGNGKGKTTAALGLAMRALGWNKKVCMIQFIKGKKKLGEINITKSHIPEFSIHQFSNSNKIIIKPSQLDKLNAEKTLMFAKKLINSKKYDLIILDEINPAIKLKLIDVKKVIDVLKNKPKNLEMILTGRDADKKIIELADLVTEMKLIKHPFYKNIPARKGIEF
jgi:cob(I)alamin adenosyltransferase